jgi:hypothetical protein
MSLPWPQLFFETLALFPAPPASLRPADCWHCLRSRPAYRTMPYGTAQKAVARLCQRRLLVRVGHGRYARAPLAP